MNVLILAAGYGTRLYAVIKDTPKPLLLINNRPLIDFIIDKLKGNANVKEFIVVTNDRFHGHFKNWQSRHELSSKIRILNDGTTTPENRLGSIGDMNFVWDREGKADDWLIVGGDNLFDYNVDDFIQFALDKRPSVTIGLYDIKDLKAATQYGVVTLNKEKKVTRLEEKPKEPQSTSVSMCFYFFPKESLGAIKEYVAEGKSLDAAGNFIQWLSEKKTVYGFQFNGKWYDIGSVESLKEAQERFLSK